MRTNFKYRASKNAANILNHNKPYNFKSHKFKKPELENIIKQEIISQKLLKVAQNFEATIVLKNKLMELEK